MPHKLTFTDASSFFASALLFTGDGDVLVKQWFFDEETQKHSIIKCKILNENCEQSIPEYEEIYTGNVKKKMIIVKRFLENMKLKEKWKNGKD